jgi:hypothetical protein
VQFSITVRQGKLASGKTPSFGEGLPDSFSLTDITELNGCDNQV